MNKYEDISEWNGFSTLDVQCFTLDFSFSCKSKIAEVSQIRYHDVFSHPTGVSRVCLSDTMAVSRALITTQTPT